MSDFPLTSTAGPDGPFHPEALQDPAGVRAALERAGYNTESLAAAWAGMNLIEDLPLLDEGTSDGHNPLHIAARLFLIGLPVSEASLGRIFTTGQIAELSAAGCLVRAADGGWYGAGFLESLGENDHLLLFSDFVRRGDLSGAHVLQHSMASRLLESLVPRRRFERALDVGCGGGDQSLLAAAHCGKVTGVDINPRALNFARMNARLNGLENIEFRQGSFFEPVAGERFDLIMSNPPYVISPEHEQTYRTGSAGGDGVSELVVRQAAEHLAEGGVAVILVNWHHSEPESWRDRPMAWMDGNGCDSWLLHSSKENSASYAAAWLRGDGKRGAAFESGLVAWNAYYERLNARWISGGIVILRRREAGGRNWFRADTNISDLQFPRRGEHAERVIAGETYVQTVADDREFLAARYRLHPDHEVSTTLSVRDGEWREGPLTLRPKPGLNFPGRINRQIMQILAGLDGTRTLEEVVLTCAQKFRVDPAKLVEPSLRAVSTFLRLGLLMPPGKEGR